MRKVLVAALIGILIGWMAPAYAVVGTATITVTDGQKPIPGATVKITFKTSSGHRRRVTRKTSSTGKVTVRVPENTDKIEITATARKCKTGHKTTGGGIFGWDTSLDLICSNGPNHHLPPARGASSPQKGGGLDITLERGGDPSAAGGGD